MKSLNTITGLVLAAIVVIVFVLGQKAQTTTSNPIRYEYKAMSLAEMFADSDAAMEKVFQMTTVARGENGQPIGINRTDMDVSDYNEALNRLADEGWELVTVNKSNYWVFRRAK